MENLISSFGYDVGDVVCEDVTGESSKKEDIGLVIYNDRWDKDNI